MACRLLACDPPLSQTAVVAEKVVNFTVLLEVEDEDGKRNWDVAIWHNSTVGQEWTALNLSARKDPLKMIQSPLQPQLIPGTHRKYFFVGSLTRPPALSESVLFTVRFREKGGEWQWINDHSSHKDGEICFQNLGPISSHLSAFLQDFDGVLQVESLVQDSILTKKSPEMSLWTLTSPIEAARQQQSAFRCIKLGLPKSIIRWFALVRICRPWLAPRQGNGQFSLSEDAILASFIRYDGLHLVLLAISLDDVLSVFKSDERGNIIVFSRNDSPTQGKIRVVIAVAKTFEAANAAAFQHARTILGTADNALREEQRELMARSLANVDPLKLEEWHDSFTYCTWNGLGLNLDEERMLEALKTLEKNDLKITNLIIDDNWQSLDSYGQSAHDRRWTDFEANKAGFPKGLKNTVKKLRDGNPHIQYVAVWHGIFGYWGGTSPSGDIAKRYKTRQVKMQENGFESVNSMTVVDAEDAYQIYEDFYKFLTDAGINSVKADTQFFVEHLDNAEDRRRFITTYQNAWTLAAVNHFGLKVISSMSLPPQFIFYSHLPPNKPCYAVRNSDDFFPNEPSSHTWHIFCNAHVSVLTQHLNMLPDWDMFQTNHVWSGFHAAARCLSGGPIYFTDEPGKHDLSLIDQMTAKTATSRIILRPGVGKTTQVYAGHLEPVLCKIGTSWSPEGVVGSVILGVFNVGQHSLSELFALRAFPNIQPDQAYVIRAHTTGEISRRVMLHDDAPAILLNLPEWGYEILTVFPLLSLPIRSVATTVSTAAVQAMEIAILGLLHKMTGVAAVRKAKIKLLGNNEPAPELEIEITLKALGILGIYIHPPSASPPPKTTVHVSNNIPIPSQFINFNPETSVMEIDLEGAWEDSDRKKKGKDGEWKWPLVVEVKWFG